jgi:predicted protein tyrosine phosphatase
VIELMPRFWCGNQLDYETRVKKEPLWAVVHACKEPYHRQMVGYVGRGAPTDDDEYLFARRGSRLALNLVDVADPKFIHRDIIDEAMSFIAEHYGSGTPTFVHCNQGGSRGPTIAMLYMAPQLPERFEDAEGAFRELYPSYLPAGGMRGYAKAHWSDYHAP